MAQLIIIRNTKEIDKSGNHFNWYMYLLVLPSGNKVSKALSVYAEHVILLYLQNSFADNSNISLNTSARPTIKFVSITFIYY